MNADKDVLATFLQDIGKNISKKRKKRKMSLEQLGLEVGLTRMHVHRIERGYNITLTTLLKLSLALGIKMEGLIKLDYRLKKDDLERLININKSNKKSKKH